jgi:hypothetical protein
MPLLHANNYTSTIDTTQSVQLRAGQSKASYACILLLICMCVLSESRTEQSVICMYPPPHMHVCPK